MKLSNGELAQMEAAARNREEHQTLEEEIMGKWAKGELVEPIRCYQCKCNVNRKKEPALPPFCPIMYRTTNDDDYCSFAVLDETIAERKEKDNDR